MAPIRATINSYILRDYYPTKCSRQNIPYNSPREIISCCEYSGDEPKKTICRHNISEKSKSIFDLLARDNWRHHQYKQNENPIPEKNRP